MFNGGEIKYWSRVTVLDSFTVEEFTPWGVRKMTYEKKEGEQKPEITTAGHTLKGVAEPSLENYYAVREQQMRAIEFIDKYIREPNFPSDLWSQRFGDFEWRNELYCEESESFYHKLPVIDVVDGGFDGREFSFEVRRLRIQEGDNIFFVDMADRDGDGRIDYLNILKEVSIRRPLQQIAHLTGNDFAFIADRVLAIGATLCVSYGAMK